MDEGCEEILEYGFGRQCVVYAKGDLRIMYNEKTNEIRGEYLAPTGRKE